MTIQIVFETHSLELVTAPFHWQEGWVYELTADAVSTASRSEET
jgi:hypothetical protein